MVNREQLTFGVDLGGTSTRVGLYDSAMRLLGSAAIPTRVAAGPQSCVKEIADVIRSVGERGGSLGRENTLGIGIGSPGPINLRTGVLGLLPNLTGWEDFPLRDALAEASGQTVILESDANAAALAEWKLGAAMNSQFDSMAMITLGTGVGSGIILKGNVWQGRFGMGGEVGHATVNLGGPCAAVAAAAAWKCMPPLMDLSASRRKRFWPGRGPPRSPRLWRSPAALHPWTSPCWQSGTAPPGRCLRHWAFTWVSASPT